MMEQEKSMDTMVIRCHDCGGTQIWKRKDDGEIETYHGCFNGKQSRESFANLTEQLAAKDAAIAAYKGAVHADVAEFTRDSATLEAQAEQIRVLREHIHELLHWIYPREGDPEHRTDQFVAEAIIGFMLLGEDHPFEKAEKDEEAARAALASTAPAAEKKEGK